MLSVVASIYSLLLGIGILLLGMGLLGTLLAVRASLEGFPVVATGFIMSGYFFGYVLGTLLCPALIQRVGHIRAFAAMAAVASASAIAHALFVHPIAWGVLRVITGLNMVGLYMVIESWLNSVTPNQWRGRVFSVYMMVTLLALAGGQFLILAGDLQDFIPFGLVAICLSLGLVPIALTRVAQPQAVESPSFSLKKLYAISPLGLVGTLVAGLIGGAFWGMGPVFGMRIGLSAGGVASFMSATIVGGAFLQWPIGRLSDRFDRRKVLVGVAFLGSLLALAAFVATQISMTLLMITAFFCGGAFFAAYSLSVAHLNDHLSPHEVLEATRGLLLIYGIGTTFGPSAASLSMTSLGPGSLFLYFAAALATLVLFGSYRMLKSAPVPVQDQGEFVPLVRTSQAALEMYPEADAQATFSSTSATGR